MLFGNVLSGLTQVAKSVVGLFRDDSQTEITFHDDELHVLAPVAQPLIIEEWKDIDWPGADLRLVQVSTLGRVRAAIISRQNNRWADSSDGEWFYPSIYTVGKYKCVSICADDVKRFNINLPFAILTAFVEPMPAYIGKVAPIKVIYKDGDINNLNLENLRWATAQEATRIKPQKPEPKPKKFVIPTNWKQVDGKSWNNERKLYLCETADGVEFYIQKKANPNEYRLAHLSDQKGHCGARYLGVAYSGGTKCINAPKTVLEVLKGEMQPDYIQERGPSIHYADGNRNNLHPSNLRWLTQDELSSILTQRANKSNQVRLSKVSQNSEEAEHERRINKVLADVDKQDKQDKQEDWVLTPVEPVVEKVAPIQTPSQIFIDFNKAMREEVWVPIPKYEDTYEISSFGNVRSVSRFVTRHRTKRVNGVEEKVPYSFPIQGHRIKPFMNDGVLVINLTRGGKQALFSIAKLVIAVFAKDKLTSKNFQVIHLNGNTNNCRLNNLRIVDDYQAA